MTIEELRESLLATPKNGYARITAEQKAWMPTAHIRVLFTPALPSAHLGWTGGGGQWTVEGTSSHEPVSILMRSDHLPPAPGAWPCPLSMREHHGHFSGTCSAGQAPSVPLMSQARPTPCFPRKRQGSEVF